MNRILVFALVVSLGHSSVALASGTLLASATRITREVAETQPLQRKNAAAVNAVRTDARLAITQAQGGLASSGMKKRTKVLIWMAAALAFSGGVFLIDRGVEDSTPSSLGLR